MVFCPYHMTGIPKYPIRAVLWNFSNSHFCNRTNQKLPEQECEFYPAIKHKSFTDENKIEIFQSSWLHFIFL